MKDGKMNLAILGAGRIASKMAGTVMQMDDVSLYAAASRDGARAQAFANRYGAKKAFGSYEDMLRDDGVDLVYVATPHSHHCIHTKLCLEYGRPVLCEKAFARDAREAEEMLELAQKKGIFLTEAMWVRYMPMTQILRKLISDGRIGEVTSLTADLGYSLMHKERMIRPELAGGALLDLGVYTLNFATTVLGDDVERIVTAMAPHETGVDKSEFINLIYPGGKLAGLYNTMEAVTEQNGFIYGTKGWIEAEYINNYRSFRIYNNQRELVEEILCPEQITGYEYELRACRRALLQGKTECEEMPHEHTLNVMRILDRIRDVWRNESTAC